MSSESEDDDKSKPPKTRGEVSAQEQQRIAEETKNNLFILTVVFVSDLSLKNQLGKQVTIMSGRFNMENSINKWMYDDDQMNCLGYI